MRRLRSAREERETFSASRDGRSNPTTAKKRRCWYRWPRITIDLSHPRHRRSLLMGLFGFAFLGISLTVVGYKGYAYTESDEFCGTACHPMRPQFARYERSPHANVECVDCHIGPGFKSFVESKINGIGQVVGVLTDNFERPIKSPVHSLRPARETCENCHTPTLFKDNIIKLINHYDNDESNTPVQSTLILKMGGWTEAAGITRGIHWHITSPIYYIAADEQRQVILWVGVAQPDGTLKEYFARDMLDMSKTTFVAEARANDEVREMDCIDCHNRTAHEIPPPEELVDDTIRSGLIASSIPYIRAKSIEVLSPQYSSMAEAHSAIDGLMESYQVGYPEIYEEQYVDFVRAGNKLKQIYDSTNFPEMGLNWETNPNNQAHSPTLGCFRCHDGKHVLADDSGNELTTISVKCNLCHTVPIVGRGDNLLVEAPVIVGSTPESHSDFSWTIEHRDVPEADQKACFQCHGEGFCNNGVCHSLSHPDDMLFTHAEEYRKQGNQVCYTCHQDVLCSRCHPGGIVDNP